MIEKSLLPLLKACSTCKPTEFSAIIDHLSDKSVDSICECVYNVINTDLKFSKKKRLKLKNHITSKCEPRKIRKIGNRNVSISKRRALLKQQGTGLPMILASVIPFLTSLFTGK